MEQQLLEELETKRRLQEEEESRKMVSYFSQLFSDCFTAGVVFLACASCRERAWVRSAAQTIGSRPFRRFSALC